MIPRVLHHIWLRPEPMPPHFLRSVRAWREWHPDWEQNVWTGGRLPALRESSAFFSLNGVEDREELLRLELLYQFGGVWVRGDVEPLQPWDETAAQSEAFQLHDACGCAVSGAVPWHPFFDWAMKTGMRLAGRLRRSPPGVWLDALREALAGPNTPSDRPLEMSAWRRRIRLSAGPNPATTFSPEDIVIAIRTIDRNPQYIHQTLGSLFAADEWVRRTGEVLLLVGNEADEYLGNYLHHAALRVLPLSPAKREQFRSLDGNHRRFNFNLCRSLRVPLAGKIGVLSCEDDLAFRDDFLRRLLATVSEIEIEHQIRDYVLSLYPCYDFERNPSARLGQRFCRYADRFYGTLALYVPAAVAPLLASVIEQEGIVEGNMPGDLIIRDTMPERILATPRALVQHIGVVSTGLGGGCLNKTFFHRPYVSIPAEDWGRTPGAITPVAMPWAE